MPFIQNVVISTCSQHRMISEIFCVFYRSLRSGVYFTLTDCLYLNSPDMTSSAHWPQHWMAQEGVTEWESRDAMERTLTVLLASTSLSGQHKHWQLKRLTKVPFNNGAHFFDKLDSSSSYMRCAGWDNLFSSFKHQYFVTAWHSFISTLFSKK